MRDYTPRRCSKRWLDADCPREVLAIIDHGKLEVDRFDIFYIDVKEIHYGSYGYVERWMSFLSSDEDGRVYRGEMKAHEVAAYRYRMKHRYAKWSELPEAVKNAVRRDIQEAGAEK